MSKRLAIGQKFRSRIQQVLPPEFLTGIFEKGSMITLSRRAHLITLIFGEFSFFYSVLFVPLWFFAQTLTNVP